MATPSFAPKHFAGTPFSYLLTSHKRLVSLLHWDIRILANPLFLTHLIFLIKIYLNYKSAWLSFDHEGLGCASILFLFMLVAGFCYVLFGLIVLTVMVCSAGVFTMIVSCLGDPFIGAEIVNIRTHTQKTLMSGPYEWTCIKPRYYCSCSLQWHSCWDHQKWYY